MKEYYNILGLAEGASFETVKKKYNELLIEFDPETQSDDDLKKFFKREQNKLREAYEKISLNYNKLKKEDVFDNKNKKNNKKVSFFKVSSFLVIFVSLIFVLIKFFYFDKDSINLESKPLIPNQTPTQLISGCTDSLACNYNPSATLNDRSCRRVYGCTDPTAVNFFIEACIDDGSCYYEIYGCTDSLAINYDSNANMDDGSCSYNLPIYSEGCADSNACNFGDYEFSDNSSCIYISNNSADIRSGIWNIKFKWKSSDETIASNRRFLSGSANAAGTILSTAIDDSFFSDFQWSMCENNFKMWSGSTAIYTGYFSNGEIKGTMINNYNGNNGTFLITKEILNQNQNNNSQVEQVSSVGCTDSNACNFGDYEFSDNSSCIYFSNNSADIRNGEWNIRFKWKNADEILASNQMFLFDSPSAPGTTDGSNFLGFQWSMCENTFKMWTNSAIYTGYFSDGEIRGTMKNPNNGNIGEFNITRY